MTGEQPHSTAYQRALGKLSRMHHDEFADLLAAERLAMGLRAERLKARCGTRSAYNGGCRCLRCRKAVRDYQRMRRKRGLADDDPRHGELRGYGAGCRCDACLGAKRAYSREWHRKRKDHAVEIPQT